MLVYRGTVAGLRTLLRLLATVGDLRRCMDLLADN